MVYGSELDFLLKIFNQLLTIIEFNKQEDVITQKNNEISEKINDHLSSNKLDVNSITKFVNLIHMMKINIMKLLNYY